MYYSKTEQRKQIKSIISAIDRSTIDSWANSVFRQIETLPEWQSAQTIGLYCALADELPTSLVIERWSHLKRLALPVVRGDEMDFYEYKIRSAMHRGAYNILEPDTQTLVCPQEIDLIIVPGVAFTASGCRLGRGKGYYDKYLLRTSSYRVGVCLACQLLDELACQPHDQQMDRVCVPIL